VDFEDLKRRLQASDQDAAREVYHHFARRLIGLARERLGARLRAQVDPEDVVNSVFKSFFLRQAKGDFDLDNWDDLWTLLFVITLRKCGHQVEYFHAQRRDVRRQVSATPDSDSSDPHLVAFAREPTPQEALELAETVEALMRDLRPRERQVLEMTLQGGHSTAEISAAVQRTEHFVRLVLRRIRKTLQERLQQGNGNKGMGQ
jgi:RNA polymerase sigma-70 factor (ECF subfamily)